MRLAIAQPLRRGVDRVVAHYEIVHVRSRRAEDEFRIGKRLEIHRFIRRLKRHEISMPQNIGRRHDTRCQRDPQNGVSRGRLVAPVLSSLQAYG